MASGKTNPGDFRLTNNVVEQAYLYLKSYSYHENINFFLKQKIAEFECDPRFDENIRKLSDSLRRKNFTTSPAFKKWLESVDCRILPKSFKSPEDRNGNGRKDGGLLISNVTTSSEYLADRVNYFISAPVELHIIEVLWCLVVGPLVEEDLQECCCGSRLHDLAKNFTRQENTGNFTTLFRLYVKQYNSWRDQALKVATEISKKDEDVALLFLDFKSYFYEVNLNFEKIVNRIEKAFEDDRLCGIALKLTDSLRSILSAYHEKTASLMKSTHPECGDKTFLPIGFASSSILANWYLTEFDGEILETVRPDYYGRYVDDIIMVFRNPGTAEAIRTSIESFVGKFLERQLMRGGEEDSDPYFYAQVGDNRLPVQRDKLILHLLDREHSQVGLEVLKQELEERSSAFRFLPGEDVDRDLDRFAYDIVYEGSRNKPRSVAGVVENETELVAYLTRHIALHRLCEADRKDSVLPQLKRFFKGRNALRFSRLWEKVYQYAVVVKDNKFVRTFYESLDSEIAKTKALSAAGKPVDRLSGKLRKDLKLYNKISLGLCVALLDEELFRPEDEKNKPGEKGKRLLAAFVRGEGIGSLAAAFRGSNTLRHSLVAWPLANFTGFTGDLTDEREFRNAHSGMEDPDLEDRKIVLSPRFIHFDEWQSFYLQKALAEGRSIALLRWQKEFKREYEKYFFNVPVERSGDGKTGEDLQALVNRKVAERLKKAFSGSGDKEKGKGREDGGRVRRFLFSVGKKTESPPEKMRIALANIKVRESDIKRAARKDRKPNTGIGRQRDLYKILNQTLEEKADILVMPELSIPVSWLPFMVDHCRRHKQAMIFGLEHWEAKGIVYNLLVELLPFKVSEKYRSCFMTARVKNHYSPYELKLIQNLRLKPANAPGNHGSYYNRISWNGITFASYNCFELSDIEHRTLFKSEIDVLFACVYNRDTNYYGHILESAVRDLHCYVVQSNTSEYGGSCVLRPTKTEDKTMLHVKGGENPCVLVTEIDIGALRDFQYKPDPKNKHNFKPLPPGFDSEKVLDR